MERDGTHSDYNYSKPNRAIEAGIMLAELSSLARAAGEWLGILKAQPLGKKKPEGSGFWEKAKKNFRHAAIPAIMAYVRGARKVEKGTESLDMLAGVEKNEKGKWKVRAAIIALIAVPMAIIVFNIWSLASNAKPVQENKKQEKEAPAPRKATGMQVHKNDALYQMAFARQLPKSTFVAAQKPASNARQKIG